MSETDHQAHSRLRRTFELVGTVLSVALLGLVVSAAAALIVVPKATGSVPLTVLTGSMRGTYDPGDVVVVRPVAFDELRIGDAITYQIRSGDPDVVTHRVISVVLAGDGSHELITQGDANGAADPVPVKEVQVRGKVWYSVPYVGHVATALEPGKRAVLVKIVAGALLAYGGCMVAAEAWGRRRGRMSTATS
jgi:signal peptidase